LIISPFIKLGDRCTFYILMAFFFNNKLLQHNNIINDLIVLKFH